MKNFTRSIVSYPTKRGDYFPDKIVVIDTSREYHEATMVHFVLNLRLLCIGASQRLNKEIYEGEESSNSGSLAQTQLTNRRTLISRWQQEPENSQENELLVCVRSVCMIDIVVSLEKMMDFEESDNDETIEIENDKEQ